MYIVVLISMILGMKAINVYPFYLSEEGFGIVNVEDEWGGICQDGRRQSPIDLVENAAIVARYPALLFQNYENSIKNAEIHNNGYTLEIDASNEYLISGGELPGIYKMDQMHFHWGSEHTIDNKRFILELHIVSYNQRYDNFSEATKNEQGIAALGVLFHISDQVNPILKNLMDSADSIKDHAGQSSKIKAPFSPIQLLPSNRSSYFRYEGSLTRPPCNEVVIWTVLANTLPITTDQIEQFRQVRGTDGALITENFRPLQPLNNRPVYFVSDMAKAN